MFLSIDPFIPTRQTLKRVDNANATRQFTAITADRQPPIVHRYYRRSSTADRPPPFIILINQLAAAAKSFKSYPVKQDGRAAGKRGTTHSKQSKCQNYHSHTYNTVLILNLQGRDGTRSVSVELFVHSSELLSA